MYTVTFAWVAVGMVVVATEVVATVAGHLPPSWCDRHLLQMMVHPKHLSFTALLFHSLLQMFASSYSALASRVLEGSLRTSSFMPVFSLWLCSCLLRLFKELECFISVKTGL